MSTPFERARRLYKSPAFRRVYCAGAQIASMGGTIDRCPYPEEQTRTWRTAYRKAWRRGFESVSPPDDEQVG